MQLVERAFTPDGEMKPMSRADKARVKGHLPFYSVDTMEEALALVELAVSEREFFRKPDGTLIEVTLVLDQTVDNLTLAGQRLAALHERLLT